MFIVKLLLIFNYNSCYLTALVRAGMKASISFFYYVFFCTGMSAPVSSLASAICNRLAAIRLLLVDSGRCDIHQRIRLNVNKDDILFALKTANKDTKDNAGKS